MMDKLEMRLVAAERRSRLSTSLSLASTALSAVILLTGWRSPLPEKLRATSLEIVGKNGNTLIYLDEDTINGGGSIAVCDSTGLIRVGIDAFKGGGYLALATNYESDAFKNGVFLRGDESGASICLTSAQSDPNKIVPILLDVSKNGNPSITVKNKRGAISFKVPK